jgi:hypothetical protein
VFHFKSKGGQNLDKQTVKYAIRRFSNLIERNKEHRAYSDFKEGINKGLDIAKFTFEDHVEKFDLSSLEDNQTIKIRDLQNEFNSLIDTLDIRKKPNCSEEHLEGIYKGFEKSKLLFEEFIKELV